MFSGVNDDRRCTVILSICLLMIPDIYVKNVNVLNLFNGIVRVIIVITVCAFSILNLLNIWNGSMTFSPCVESSSSLDLTRIQLQIFHQKDTSSFCPMCKQGLGGGVGQCHCP